VINAGPSLGIMLSFIRKSLVRPGMYAFEPHPVTYQALRQTSRGSRM
jgi:hypothetical protein